MLGSSICYDALFATAQSLLALSVVSLCTVVKLPGLENDNRPLEVLYRTRLPGHADSMIPVEMDAPPSHETLNGDTYGPVYRQNAPPPFQYNVERMRGEAESGVCKFYVMLVFQHETQDFPVPPTSTLFRPGRNVLHARPLRHRPRP